MFPFDTDEIAPPSKMHTPPPRRDTMRAQLSPPRVAKGKDSCDDAVASIPVSALRAAVEQGQITWEFALVHCPSRYISYVLGECTHD